MKTPFFTEDDFPIQACYQGGVVRIANAKIVPVLAELERLRSAQCAPYDDKYKTCEVTIGEFAKENKRLRENIYATAKTTDLLEIRIAKLEEVLKDSLPIVEAAYWDVHTAGTLPGSGYHNKAEHLASQKWGWRNPDQFEAWVKNARAALEGK